ncbi:SDR family oxidoreductase [Alteromonas pelagimontana]|uniref:SDR family oxidoreductase n=1 Tax=Alteromonas pelagimontana TaxID=1858656 RepID=A0A6M4MCD7_9ALTE|nr:SDR family oxidoreductase [Alteromonas pelagimontana]QJR80478.1 SDR family oxidoreductase [Alteromonas pelagimontana]
MSEQIDKTMPAAEFIDESYKGSGKLEGKTILISGGDSGIGRAVALHAAREGANVAIIYHNDSEDAEETRKAIEAEGANALVIQGNVGKSADCDAAIAKVIDMWGELDILVNNAGFQKPFASLTDITDDEWKAHFDVNIHGFFYLTRAALPHLGKGASIINTTSINAFAGNKHLVPYTATKGAITGFTRALALQLAEKDIRVNEVAPGPVITPIQKTFKDYDSDILKNMDEMTPMQRIGQPRELAAAYIYLACKDSSFVTGQTMHVNGGMIING